jgi:hypothetical protein
MVKKYKIGAEAVGEYRDEYFAVPAHFFFAVSIISGNRVGNTQIIQSMDLMCSPISDYLTSFWAAHLVGASVLYVTASAQQCHIVFNHNS